jgi:hypothetical protein
VPCREEAVCDTRKAEQGVLRKILGFKKEEVIGWKRKLHN